MLNKTELVQKLQKENGELKQELMDIANIELIKKLNRSLERVAKGKFVSRAQLGI